jgi:hypothetical protein
MKGRPSGRPFAFVRTSPDTSARPVVPPVVGGSPTTFRGFQKVFKTAA